MWFGGKTYPELSYERERVEVFNAITDAGVLSVEMMHKVATLLQEQMLGKTVTYHYVEHGNTVRVGYAYPGCQLSTVLYYEKVRQIVLHVQGERVLTLTPKTEFRLLRYEDSLVYEFCQTNMGEQFRHYLELQTPP